MIECGSRASWPVWDARPMIGLPPTTPGGATRGHLRHRRTAGCLIPPLTADPVERISGASPRPADLGPSTGVRLKEGDEVMKFGIMFQLQTPRPIDADQWHEHDELNIYHEALEQIEL